MFERAKPEEFVFDYPAACVCNIGIQAAIRLGGQGRESRLGIQARPAEDISRFSVQCVRPGFCDGVEYRAAGISEFRRKAIVDLLDFANERIRDGKQTNASAIALRVVAAIQFIVDAVGEAVGVALTWHAKFRVRTGAGVRLEK